MTDDHLYRCIAALKARYAQIQDLIRSLELLQSPTTEWDSFTMGRKGGLARASKLTPKQRSEAARRAVLVR
jgi:hypothetical protein